MPPGSVQYTLVGFSRELDWRPLVFVKPIPQHRVCGACGLVRQRTALLPCAHTLCESCFELCAQHGVRVCPLDGRRSVDGDVEMRDWDADELLKREVKCCNENNKCGKVLPASDIALHFQRECLHHSISCAKCSTAVLCRDVFKHLRSECSNTARSCAHDYEEESNFKDTAIILASFRQMLEQQAGEMKALLERLLTGTGVNSDRLNEIVHGVNSCKEAMREVCERINREEERVRQQDAEESREQREYQKKCFDEIATFIQETRGRFIASSAALEVIANDIHTMDMALKDMSTRAASEKLEKHGKTADQTEEAQDRELEVNTETVHPIEKTLLPSVLQSVCCEFLVKDVKSLREQALQCGRVVSFTKRVYLRGYHMAPGDTLKSHAGTTNLHARFLLHKGSMDNSINWPFVRTIRLRVVHPKGGAQCELEECNRGDLASCQRPDDSRPQLARSTRASLSLDDLIRDGYVEEDQLVLLFELPPLSGIQ